MQWCHWWLHWHYMTLMPIPKASHDQKCHFSPHCSFRNVWNALVPLMMLMAPCDTHASANSIELWKSHFAPHLDHLNLRNAMSTLMVLSISYDVDTKCSSITWLQHYCQWIYVMAVLMSVASHDKEKSGYISFQLAWPKECSGAIFYTIGIIWCKHQC